MKTWKKVLIGTGVALVLVIIVSITVYQSHKNLVTVQTGKAQKQNLASVVSASGEIKPKTYVNIGANAFGKIVKLHVREGDRVKKGQLLAQLENVQSAADVNATRASLQASETDSVAADAGMKTAMADLNRAKSDEARAKLDYERAQGLYRDQLIAKQEYDAKKAAWESADAGVAQALARVAQGKAQKDSSDKRITQNSANLTRVSDVLRKTTYEAPFDGVITNLPVREGETVVIGIQNSPGSTLMTLADMSVITSEVKVVTEIGNNAIVRSTGVATSQQSSTSQEAKDFKVVVTLTDPPPDLRPGLSSTAKITTATRSSVLSIPIQALTIRSRADLENKASEKDSVKAASAPVDAAKQKEEIQGVFVIRNKKAEFVPVETGISGTTDIEITKGLQESDEVITGSYKVLRTLKPGTSVKIDNSAPKKEEESS